jgi:hypothetical protein
MIDSLSKKTAGCERKMSSSLPATSEHLPPPRKAAPNIKRNTTVRRISSYSASGDRIINNGIRCRCVSFARDVKEVGEVPSRSELSELEFRSTWYTKEDFKAMKRAFIPTLKKMAKNIPLSDDEEPRGLEHSTPRGSRSRTDNRYQAMDTVLDEQERQWEQDRKDPLYLAKLYRQSSAHCQMNAYLVAQKDAEYVQQILDDEMGSSEQKEASREPSVLNENERRIFGIETAANSDNESLTKGGVTPIALHRAKGSGSPKTLKSSTISACGRLGIEVLAQ